jgi:2-methylcitrate dehydratase PrpD
VLALTGKRAPRTALESHVSVFHWAAVSLLQDSPGLAATQPACLHDPGIVRLRDQIQAEGSPEIGKGEATAKVTLVDGAVLNAHVVDARGSQARPMTDVELEAKFFELTRPKLPRSSEMLRDACWGIAEAADVGHDIGRHLP